MQNADSTRRQPFCKFEFVEVFLLALRPNLPLWGEVANALAFDGGVVSLHVILLPLSQPTADSSPDKGSL